mgnify:CR=1 FL=1
MQVFTPHIGLKLLIGGLFVLLGLFILGACVGSLFDPEALYLVALLVLMELGLAWVGFRTFRWVSLDDEELVYGGLLGRTRIRLADIESVELGHALRIRAAGTWRVAIRMEHRGKLGELTTALRRRVPDAFQRRSRLPFRWRARGMVIGGNLLYVALSALMAAIGGGGMVEGARSAWAGLWGEALRFAGMGGLMGLVGFGMLLWILTCTLLWVDFREDRIVARYPVRWRSFAVKDLDGVSLDSEQRTYRGFTRTAWFLDLVFGRGRTLRIEPTENGVSGELASAADLDELTVLRDDLVRFYGVTPEE